MYTIPKILFWYFKLIRTYKTDPGTSESEGKPRMQVNFILQLVSSGLVPEQKSKMAKTWKAMCFWSSSPRTRHGLPLVTPGAILSQHIVPCDLPHGSWTRQYPTRHMLVLLPSHNASHAVFPFASSDCYAPRLSRSSRVPLLLQRAVSYGKPVLYNTPLPTWGVRARIWCLTRTFWWNDEGN